jgi:hypothetical protein
MYGPPHFCKRRDEFGGLVCANVFGLAGVLFATDHDGTRCALFLTYNKEAVMARSNCALFIGLRLLCMV